ncbi:hypothetical protein LIER_12251 [Lithospermum erythrorhizon]|uniref:Uncharacterized protein n=1 Tax=Lithospermum erythrorhizon TaxID=34254 RepID=A0AAV3PW79_LITER
MAHVEPNFPLFFNMHITSNSATSFSSLSDYNIFVEDKPDKVSEGRWHSKWYYTFGGMGEGVLKIWTPLSKAKHPKFTKSAQVKAQISLLQKVFQNPWDYKVFCEEGVLIHAGMIRSKRFDSFVEPPITWEEVLTTALSFVEPRKVPFSTIKGKRIPLFKRAGVVTKIVAETSAPVSADGSSTTLGKRPSNPAAPPKPVLAKRTKTLAHRPARREVLDLTKEPLPSAPFGDTNIFEAPFADTPIVSGGSSKGKEKESDSDPKVIAGYSTTYLNLPYTLPGGYEEYSDRLKLQGIIAKHLVRAMNTSHVLARRVDRLDVDIGLNRESERASQFKVHELEKENEDLLWNQETAYNEKKTATKQALAEIAKCKDLEVKNVKLEGEKFDLSLKLSRLELSLNKATKRANKAEQKTLRAQESADKVVGEYRSSKAYHDELGEEMAYFLCRFVKIFKDINPSLTDHYQEFINGYPSRWFSSLDINAPLSPIECEGNESASEAQG